MPAPAFLQTTATQHAMHAAAAAAPAAKAASGGGLLDTAFDDLLDIVNPLQHLPVIGTLYRAITGDTIGTVARIAGDALYGGVWGAAGAAADSVFEAATGKDFGSTVLAFAEDTLGFGHHQAPMAVAANTPPKPAKPQAEAIKTDNAGVLAFSTALAAKGVDHDLASRALYAYRRSQGLVPLGLN